MDDEPDETSPLDPWYGVVLSHKHGGPLRWSRDDQAWLRRRQVGDWLEWETEPVVGDDVDADEYVDALVAADVFLAGRWCPRCMAGPRPETHFIALDIHRHPQVFCVQSPAYEIVGGGGVKKHLGGPGGCQHVRPTRLQGPVLGVSDYAVVGGLVYGQPLLADDAMMRQWCGICRRGALRLRERDVDGSDGDRLDHELRLGDLGRLLSDR